VDVGIVAAIVAITAVVGVAVGFIVGKGRGGTGGSVSKGADLRPALSQLVRDLKSGSVPEKGGGAEIEAARAAIAAWAPKATGRDIAFRTALRRMHGFLETRIDAPLRRGLKGRRSLSSAVKLARAAVQDLEMFMSDPSGDSQREDLTELVRSAATDFADEWDVNLRIAPPSKKIHVMARAGVLHDALYLILHNAAQFGSNGPVSVEIREEEGWGRVLVRDDGPGFSPDALSRAYDPFYSTTDGGLGVGLSHARQVVEDQGGRIHLRNAEGGGAEVEIALPVTD
jgi:signal transduction histidine kinase